MASATVCLACQRPLFLQGRLFSVPVSETVAANALCRACAQGLSTDEILSYVSSLLASWPPEPHLKENEPGRLETARRALEAWATNRQGDEDPLDVQDRVARSLEKP
jgi:hypothetical protein